MRNKVIFIGVLMAIIIFFWSSGAMAQCAMCKAVVESTETEGTLSIGKGLNKGILYLMGIPYVLIFLLLRKKLKSFFKEFFQTAG